MNIPQAAIDAAADALEQLDGADLSTIAEASLQAALPHLLAERPIGFVKHAGAGEIVFRQAGHPSNDPGAPWRPVYLRDA